MTARLPKPAKARRFAVSVRRLALIVLLVALVLGYFANRSQRRERAIADIQSSGGQVSYAPSASPIRPPGAWSRFRSWVDDRLARFAPPDIEGADFAGSTSLSKQKLASIGSLRSLTTLSLESTSVAGADLAVLAPLAHLRTLNFANTEVGDEGLAHLESLSSLQDLDLSNTEITDEGLAHLASLTQLRRLALSDTRITDAGLVHLKRLTQLQTLELAHTRTQGKGFAHLESLRQIQSLDLSRTPLTDAGLAFLSHRITLTTLNLEATAISDVGLGSLSGLTRLQTLSLAKIKVGQTALAPLRRLTLLTSLDLHQTAVDDHGLSSLSGLTQLADLDLGGTRVRGAGLAELKAMSKLATLNLDNTLVDDDGLSRLPNLGGLTTLSLRRTLVGDAGAYPLTKLPALATLNLNGSNLSDAGFTLLCAIPTLQFLDVSGTKVQSSSAKTLGRSRPTLTVVRPFTASLTTQSTELAQAGRGNPRPAAVAGISTGSPQDAAAKAGEPSEAGGVGEVRSKGHFFTSDDKMMCVNVYTTAPDADRKAPALFAHTLTNRLGRIKGIDTVRSLGDRVSATRIRLNPDSMRAHKLSPEDVMRALTPTTWSPRRGWFGESMGKVFQLKEYELSQIWYYFNLEHSNHIVLKASPDGEILRLKDVGRVELVSTPVDVSSDIDGHFAATILLNRAPGSDSAEVIEAVKEELKHIKMEPGPPGMEFEVIPFENHRMIYAVIETPQGSTREDTSAKCHELGAIAKGINGIISVTSLVGYHMRTEGGGSNLGTCLIHLKDRSDRKLTSRQIIETLEARCRTMNVPLEFFEPPAVSVFVTAGGFSVRVLDRSNSNNNDRPGRGAEAIMDDLLNRKDLASLFSFLASNYPPYELVIDNDAALQKGVSIANAIKNLPIIAGGDVQDERKFRSFVEGFSHLFVKNDRGEMVPYSGFMKLKNKLGLDESGR